MDATSGNQVECPICLQNFDQETIEKHVDKCLLATTEKPVTRNQNKSPSKFFNKKNAKRVAKNEIRSSTVSNKKIKCELDLDGKDNYRENMTTFPLLCDNAGSSKESSENKLSDLAIGDVVVVKKEIKEDCNENLLSPKTNTVTFFNKKTLKQRKNEKKESIENVKKKVVSSIDLTECTENENIKPKENMDAEVNFMNAEVNSGICCVSSVSKDILEDNLDNTAKTIEKGTVNCNSGTVTTLPSTKPLIHNIAGKEIGTKENSKLKFTCVKLDFLNNNGNEDKVRAPPSLPFIDTSEMNNSSVTKNSPTSLHSKSNCTPSKENYGMSRVIDHVITKSECVTPPMTKFQQELFNMSTGSDVRTPSPPATSNFHVRNETFHVGTEKGEKVTPKTKNHGVNTIFSAKTVIHEKITDIPRVLNEKIKENKEVIVEQKKKKENEIILGKLPLAEQMRPDSLDDYVGQVAVGTQKLLKELFYNDRIPSMILWGPPGCGKTTLAHIISHQCKSGQRYRYVSLSATMSGINDVKEAVKIAKNEKRLRQKHTVLFIDEVHRFNKMQQDSFLPHIEDGTIVLIGATTENPSFHLNNALTSRCRIVVLNPLNVDSIMKILRNAVFKLGGIETTEEQNGSADFRFILENGVVNLLADYSNGDARIALTSLDMLLQAKITSNNGTKNSTPTITCEQIKEEVKRGHVNYDRKGDEHYDIISAFHKSIRGGDQDAAIYWLARMLEGGEDPLYIARRLIVISSEDIGIGDPSALNQAVSAYQACQFIGMPECGLVLAQVATYLSNAPKSIASYVAYKKAKTLIKECTGPQPSVPLHLRNAPTNLMKNLGYGKGYKYTPNFKDEEGEQDYLPREIVGTKFFT